MSRVNVYKRNDEYDYEGTRVLEGWFDLAKASGWTDRDYNGNGSGGTGRGEAVYRTAGGRWVLCNWSSWQGETNRYEYITADEARDWLLRNREDRAVEEYFGEIPEEEDRRGGRPEIGGRISTALGDSLLADLDAYVKENGGTRAEAIRRLLQEALLAGQPYTVTAEDISTRNREIVSRHASLGAAVEALREEQAYDREDNGLPSRYPRVEHDGRPVDVEAYE